MGEIGINDKAKALLKAFLITSWLFIQETLFPNFIKKIILAKEYVTPEAMETRLKQNIFGGYKMFKHIYEMSLIQKAKRAEVGKNIEDIKLIDYKTKKSVSLSSLQRPGVPLVLNFGSCT